MIHFLDMTGTLSSVLSSNNSIVMYEVMLSIQRLVNKFGLELKDPAWDLVLSIMEAIIEHIETDSRTSPASQVTSTLHDTICTIEQLMELGQFHGSVRRVFELIERCSPVRPEASVLRLIMFLSNNIIPIRSDWIQKLHSLVDKYFKQETRTTIRVRALDVLSNVISLNRPAYEDELIELIVVPQLQHIECDPDILVRNVAAQLLVDLALECENKRCLELLDILEKLLNRPLEQQGDVPITSEQDVADVKTVVVGLINIFTSKLFQLPSSHAIKAYKLLVGHLEAHYLKPAVFELVSSTRYLIFECFLRLRANSLYGLGYPDSVTGQVRFSPYLLVDHKEGERTGGGDWKVLSLILQEVPQVMKNKALILSHHGNEIDLLASALCAMVQFQIHEYGTVLGNVPDKSDGAMVSDKSLGLPESLQNTPPKFTRSEFHTFVLPVLASLASYHGYLDPGHQQRLIKCLEFGLVSRCSRQCVMALTICALEMKDAMYKLLPEVLLNLSKISATVHIAIPLLEFLSTLTRLPKVFASFVGDQYMSVFAISLPYTNPFKYNHYTVSLAHHVIAVWFLKCRLPFRRDFVKFITTGLKANVIVPFEEGQLIMKSDLINEDSSSRKRSSSLTEQGSRRSLRTVGIRPEGRPGDLKPPIDEALMNFHMELTETCIDLMARYTFSTCSAQPKRLPTAEFLLSGGQSMTWILGNRVITVTTSGCSQKVLKNGLCDKCWMLCRPDKGAGCCVGPTKVRLCDKCRMLCRPDKESLSPDVSVDQEPQPGKQLHKSTNQRPVSNDVGSGSKDSRSFVTPDSSIISAPVEDKGKTLAAPDTHEPEPHRLEQIVFGPNEPEKQERQFCACWCQGWAEIHIRRPTGKKEDLMSSHKRINSETLAESEYDAILDQHFEHTPDDVECTSHVLGINTGPSGPILIPGSPLKRSISRQNSRESLDNETDCYETDGRSRNPVRRSNSSPEMSASWKNPFMNRDKEREGKPLPLPLDRDDSGEMETKQETPTEAKKPAKLSKDPRSVIHTGVFNTRSVQPLALQQRLPQTKELKSSPDTPRLSVSRQHVTSSTTPTTTSQLTINTSSASADKLSIKDEPHRPDPSALPPLAFKRGRGHTISVMSPIRKPPRLDWSNASKENSPRNKDTPRSGISPSIFSQQHPVQSNYYYFLRKMLQ
uniref:Tuberin n=1 Tax=Timema bartmani TaxID=61472 RepID=A0A7R9EUQ0_9NEOP|nr:unnamed protein product [Timema bartmani]